MPANRVRDRKAHTLPMLFQFASQRWAPRPITAKGSVPTERSPHLQFRPPPPLGSTKAFENIRSLESARLYLGQGIAFPVGLTDFP